MSDWLAQDKWSLDARQADYQSTPESVVESYRQAYPQGVPDPSRAMRRR